MNKSLIGEFYKKLKESANTIGDKTSKSGNYVTITFHKGFQFEKELDKYIKETYSNFNNNLKMIEYSSNLNGIQQGKNSSKFTGIVNARFSFN